MPVVEGAIVRIAVSGSSGFIGSKLVEWLTSRGHSVCRLRRSQTTPVEPTDIVWSPDQGLANPAELNGFDALIHLAGKNIADARWTESVKQQIRDSRAQATRLLASQVAGIQEPPNVVISASAVGIYGNRGAETVTENSTLGDDFLAEVCKQWEAACTPWTEAGIRVANPRLGIVLDPSGGVLAKMLPLFRSLLGGKVGSGEQFVPWISLEDVICGIVWLLENESCQGPYNFVAPNPVRNQEFAQSLARSLGRPSWLPVPSVALKAVLGSEMANALALGGCRVSPTRLLESGFAFEYETLEAYFASQFVPSKKRA